MKSHTLKGKDTMVKERKLTQEEAIILDCWLQYAPTSGKKGRYAGGMSAMEESEYYLQAHKLINSWGNPVKNIIW